MDKNKQSYTNILKAISLFGGVQVIQILTNLIRSKLVAILLGAAGMGVSSLYLVSLNMVGNITGFGLNFSAVRDISQSFESNDDIKISRTIKIFRRWVWFSGLLGAIIIILFSSVLSKFTFGNEDYTWAFVWLSVILVLNALASGNTALLQGTKRLKDTARSTVFGSVVGLGTSVPLYYYFGVKGIIPALIMAAATSYISSWYFARQIKQVKTEVTYQETLKEGQQMVKLGVIMMISVFAGALVNYLIDTYVRHKGGVTDVGLYQAAIGITNQYIGLVFAAMSVDYFPRLAAICNDNKKVKEMVNQQAEIVVLIVAPLLVALIITAPFVIKMLLTSQFYSITQVVRLIALGMLFKAASYAIGYISFAKGDKKVFFLVEGVGSNLLTLICSLTGYYFYGINGLGAAFLVSYTIYLVAILVVTNKLYSFLLTRIFLKIFITLLLLCIITFISTMYTNIWAYIIEVLILSITGIYTFKEIDKRIGLRKMLPFFKGN